MKHVKRFAKDIGGELLTIESRPEGWAKSDYCFANVAEKIKRDGGERRFGWCFFEGKGFLMAMHHCVWVDPTSGDLVDITPSDSLPYAAAIPNVFLADPKATPITCPELRHGLSRPTRVFVYSSKADAAIVTKLMERERLKNAAISQLKGDGSDTHVLESIQELM